MRIVVIRLENLNSLRGKHEVDLAEGLRDAPIFLVVGPTGSGKSTLMDAVSLALFGETPRLHGGRKKDDHEDVDPRNAMSRGTWFASAQVEFTKVEDGVVRRYRATWQCHRARKRPDGELQLPRRSLDRLEGEAWEPVVSGTKKEDHRREFDKVLEGLTVGDFKRCVLLAQGEFAAFLKASEDERAAILERLTDTAEYQRIGERAKRRRGEAERAHEEARARLEGVSLLSEEQRAGLGAELADLEPRADLVSRELEARRGVREWIRLAADLKSSRDQAEELHALAARQRAERAAELNRLAEHERCENAWHALREWTELSSLVTEAQSAAEAHSARRAVLVGQADELRSAESSALAQQQAAHLQRQDAAPEINRARELRHRRDTAVGELRQADARFEAQSSALRDRERENAEAAGRLARAAADLDAAAAAVMALEPSRPLIESIQALRQRGDELVELHKELRRHGHDLDELRARHDKLGKTAEDRARKADEAGAQSQQADAAVERAKAAADAALAGKADARARREELRSAVEGATIRRDTVREAIRVFGEVDGHRSKMAQLEVESGKHRGALQERSEQAAIEHERGAKLAADVAGLRKELEHWRWFRQIAKERGQLRSGEPCPLCGSTEHPLIEGGAHRDRDAEVDRTCQRLDEQALLAEGQLREAAQRESSLQAEQAALAATLESMQQQARDASAALQVSERSLSTLLSGLGLPSDASKGELSAEADECEKALHALDLQRRALEDAVQAHAKALQAARTLSERLLAATRALDEAKQEAVSLEQSLSALASDRERVLDKSRRLREELTSRLAVFGIAVESGEEGVTGALEAAAGRVRALRDADAAVRQAEARRDAARTGVEKAAQACEAARKAVTEAAAERQARQSTADELEAQVAVALGGRDPEAVQQELDAQVEGASRSVDEARAGQARMAAELAAVDARIEHAAEELGKLRQHRDTARAAVDTLLAGLGLEQDDDLRARVLDASVCQELAALRKALEDEERESAVVLVERQRALEEHEARRPAGLADPVPAVEAIDTQIAGQQSELDALRDRMTECRTQLKHDRGQRAQSAALAAECEKLGKERILWETLHGLVGVKDGQAFRKFAQSLNLAELIGKANCHLARLAPRYELTQAEGSDGQSRIAFSIRDDWHAGQVRPLTTLSGGETFLVSLALALALAEYNTVKLPIETLLLDEGFGTLDQETLTVAMHTLEALHAGGRQVGIITHVERLRDKIDARVVVEAEGNGWSTVRTELGGSSSERFG